MIKVFDISSHGFTINLFKINNWYKLSQLSFNFPFENCYLTEEFLVDETNLTAFNFVSNYDSQNINLPKIFAICGPNYSGKTHLTYIWQRKTGAYFLDLNKIENLNLVNYIGPDKSYIIEDIDKIKNQEILLRIFNIISEKNANLLLTSNIDPNNIEYIFADLSSRLKNIFLLKIKEPGINLVKMLLLKNFSARQLAVEENVIDYLAVNMERSFLAINQITKLLEFYCFEEKRKITIPLSSRALENISKNKNN